MGTNTIFKTLINKVSIYWLCVLCFIFFCIETSYGGTQANHSTLQQENYTYKDALHNYEVSNYDECIKICINNLDLLEGQKSSLSQKVDYIFLLGKSYLNKPKPDSYLALKYLLQSLKIYKNLGNKNNIKENTFLLGTLYHQWKIYDKATSYYEESLNFTQTENDKVLIIESLGQCYYLLKKYDYAISVYKELIVIFHKSKEYEKLKDAYNFLFLVYQKENNYKKMLDYKRKVLSINERLQDSIDMVNTYNNIGFIYQKQERPEKAISYYKKAVKLNEKIKLIDEVTRIQTRLTITSNQAFSVNLLGKSISNEAYTKSKKKALQLYKDILKQYESIFDSTGIIKTHGFIASHYFIDNNFNKAIYHASQSVFIAERLQNKEVLAQSYKTLSDLYQHNKNFRLSQHFYKKYLDLSSTSQKEKEKEKEKNLKNQINVQKKENKYELLIAEQERQQLAYEKLKLTAEKIKSQKNLVITRLEAEHLAQREKAQSLLLEQEKLNYERMQQDIRVLEKEQQVQSLQLRQKELEQNEKEQKIELLEADKKLKEQIIDDEEILRNYAIGIIGLCILIIIIGGIAFINKQQLSKELKRRHREIERKSVELDKKNQALINSQDILHQKMGELDVQQRIIKTQTNILERTNDKLKQKDERFTKSLKYAERIQQTILPLTNSFLEHFDDFFVIYQPKYLVSGDFYWFDTCDGKKIIAIVDCTGHGVPGAFMSMVGNTLLKQIVNEQKVTQPSEILSLLNQNIRKSLNQEASNSTDGMDIGICTIEQSRNGMNIEFSGAKNNLLYISKTDGKIQSLLGDRTSIGGKSRIKITNDFKNHTVQLQKGDLLYLLTDGIIDTANKDRKRFGNKNVKSILVHNHSLSMEAQQQCLEDTLEKYQEGTEQRDDITVLGIKL